MTVVSSYKKIGYLLLLFFFTKHMEPLGCVHMEECSRSAKRSIRSPTIRKSTLLGADWDAGAWHSHAFS